MISWKDDNVEFRDDVDKMFGLHLGSLEMSTSEVIRDLTNRRQVNCESNGNIDDNCSTLFSLISIKVNDRSWVNLSNEKYVKNAWICPCVFSFDSFNE